MMIVTNNTKLYLFIKYFRFRSEISRFTESLYNLAKPQAIHPVQIYPDLIQGTVKDPHEYFNPKVKHSPYLVV